jgi:hypothetical protein
MSVVATVSTMAAPPTMALRLDFRSGDGRDGAADGGMRGADFGAAVGGGGAGGRAIGGGG